MISNTYVYKIKESRNYNLGEAWHCFNGGSSVVYNSYNLGGTRSDGPPVDNWREKIAKGTQATSNLTGSWLSLDFTPGYCYSRKLCRWLGVDNWATEELLGFFRSISSTLGAPPAVATTANASADAQALMEFVKHARAKQGAFQGSVFVAELADTLRMIRNPASGIRRAIDAYHGRARRNIRRAIARDPLSTRVGELSQANRASAARALSESWLEFQFGVKPLVADLDDALKSYRRFKDRQPRSPVFGFSNAADPPTRTTNFASSLHVRVDYEAFLTVNAYVRYYGAVKLHIDTVSTSVAEEAGFRFRDFAPALWEWIPYSFLVDYFTNISEIVEAASFPRGDIAWMAKTWRNTATRDISRSTVKPLSGSSYPNNNYTRIERFVPPRAIYERKYFERHPYNGSLIPKFQFEIPGSRKWRQYLNIGALGHLRGMRR